MILLYSITNFIFFSITLLVENFLNLIIYNKYLSLSPFFVLLFIFSITRFNNKNILFSLISFKNFPGKIWINIHLQAFSLWLKKVNLYKTPKQEIIKYSYGRKILRNENIKFVKSRKNK